MDYVSEVALAIKGEALKQLMDLNPVVVQKVLDFADEHIQDKDNHLFVWNQIRWYDNEVDIFMGNIFRIGRESYYLIDLGECIDNRYGMWDNNPFELGVTRKLHYSHGNSNGSGNDSNELSHNEKGWFWKGDWVAPASEDREWIEGYMKYVTSYNRG